MLIESKNQTQFGFSLVELSIILVIVGLLIGGVLKGLELIENSNLNATIMQVQTFTDATKTFAKTYKALPGDIADPGNRLNNCVGVPCADGGNGNGIISDTTYITSLNSLYNITDKETRGYWPQLAAAGLLSDVSTAPTLPYKWGNSFPAAEIGGGFHLQNVSINASGSVPAVRGHYFLLKKDAGSWGTGDNPIITPNQASQLDKKADDGNPQTGNWLGVGPASCSGAVYASSSTKDCSLLIRLNI